MKSIKSALTFMSYRSLILNCILAATLILFLTSILLFRYLMNNSDQIYLNNKEDLIKGLFLFGLVNYFTLSFVIGANFVYWINKVVLSKNINELARINVFWTFISFIPLLSIIIDGLIFKRINNLNKDRDLNWNKQKFHFLFSINLTKTIFGTLILLGSFLILSTYEDSFYKNYLTTEYNAVAYIMLAIFLLSILIKMIIFIYDLVRIKNIVDKLNLKNKKSAIPLILFPWVINKKIYQN
ncbi:hypothetical protein [Mycoplasma sp. E35C]|uniref:hypothetical protein n=1 Tax=Mycoplasma sp. E35C TaxID=2801918 RepID=UPI001CA39EE6|nr:hypothetical protein [Mycoplasma sp. E35C]QZX49070.1 hypothetical protein JJE79_03365 [Mycoplasma sp. E35C]